MSVEGEQLRQTVHTVSLSLNTAHSRHVVIQVSMAMRPHLLVRAQTAVLVGAGRQGRRQTVLLVVIQVSVAMSDKR